MFTVKGKYWELGVAGVGGHFWFINISDHSVDFTGIEKEPDSGRQGFSRVMIAWLPRRSDCHVEFWFKVILGQITRLPPEFVSFLSFDAWINLNLNGGPEEIVICIGFDCFCNLKICWGVWIHLVAEKIVFFLFFNFNFYLFYLFIFYEWKLINSAWE